MSKLLDGQLNQNGAADSCFFNAQVIPDAALNVFNAGVVLSREYGDLFCGAAGLRGKIWQANSDANNNDFCELGVSALVFDGTQEHTGSYAFIATIDTETDRRKAIMLEAVVNTETETSITLNADKLAVDGMGRLVIERDKPHEGIVQRLAQAIGQRISKLDIDTISEWRKHHQAQVDEYQEAFQNAYEFDCYLSRSKSDELYQLLCKAQAPAYAPTEDWAGYFRTYKNNIERAKKPWAWKPFN